MSGPRVCFVATNHGVAWGASEYLWSAAAQALAARGVEVSVSVRERSAELLVVHELQAAGCHILSRSDLQDELASKRVEVPRDGAGHVLAARPDLVVVSHGDNREGLPWMEVCAGARLRYVTVAHRASEWDWPVSELIPRLRAAYLGATAAHFVSEHNRRLTEVTICARLARAEIVRNPFFVSYQQVSPWPAGDVLRMACVARLDLDSKAHDVLLAVLARPKWRARPLLIDVVGREGPHARLIRELRDFLGVAQVTFHDQVSDIAAVWARCHALVLPSRKEGLPVAVVEAMLSGRPCLVTDVGGSAEVVEDGRSGWVAESPTPNALDRALEAAWAARAQWEVMGRRAASSIRSLVPPDPASRYADLLAKLL